MKKCSHIDRVSIHPSIKIGGVSIGQCQNRCVPGLVVCAEHASKDALVMLVKQLLKQIKELKARLNYAQGSRSIHHLAERASRTK